MRLAERVARARDMAAREFERDARHELEGRHRVAERFAQAAEELERSGRRGEANECGRNRGGSRKQAQRRRRHDAERALGADEELLEVVARVVLAQRRELVQHAPVRQHDLEAEHEGAHHAVAQHGRAAGIGRDDAAQRRAALGAERHRQQSVDGGRRRPAVRRARSPPPRSGNRFARTPRGSFACAGATAGSRCRLAAASHRRNSWCCRPAARSRCARARTTATSPATRAVESGNATSGVVPRCSRRKSISKGARSAAESSQPPGPRRSFSACRAAAGTAEAGRFMAVILLAAAPDRRGRPARRGGGYFDSAGLSSGFGLSVFFGLGGGAPTPSSMRRSSDSCCMARMRQFSTLPIRW